MLCGLALGVAMLSARGATPAPALSAQAVFRLGQLPDGTTLVGERPGLPSLEGAQAACVNCHRRSGLGSAEGQVVVPPITRTFLRQPRDQNTLSGEHRIASGYQVSRAAFDDASLARAIREGIVPGGAELSNVMPRYRLDAATMAALLAYLGRLSSAPSPGVAGGTLHLATIVTPEAQPAAREAMLAVLQAFAASPTPAFGTPRKMRHPDRMVGFRTGQLKWKLHRWELTGAPESWDMQLRRHLAAEPVFAVISGVGGRNWNPVHRFCELESLPCLLPNVDLPVDAEGDFYSIYFSRGVLLEAQLAAHWLRQLKAGHSLQRVIQVYRADDIGADASRQTRRLLSAAGIATVDKPLGPGAAGSAWVQAAGEASAGDALLLWARPDDLSQLAAAAPPAGEVLISGLMGGLQSAPLPAAWRSQARMTYPADLPQLSAPRVAIARGWLANHHVDPVDRLQERVQIDTFVACAALSEMVGNLLDTYSRDLLLERFEDMIGRSANPARYPRLGLGPGQRFASKGGYIVRFAASGADAVAADGEWIVP